MKLGQTFWKFQAKPKALKFSIKGSHFFSCPTHSTNVPKAKPQVPHFDPKPLDKHSGTSCDQHPKKKDKAPASNPRTFTQNSEGTPQ